MDLRELRLYAKNVADVAEADIRGKDTDAVVEQIIIRRETDDEDTPAWDEDFD